MDRLLRAQAKLRKQCEASRLQLVSTEIDLAITFCKVAATTNDLARSERNIANAEQAYTSASYYFGSCKQDSEIGEKLILLEFLLADFGCGIPLRKLRDQHAHRTNGY